MGNVLSRRNEWILWLAILVGATFLRVAPIATSLPYIDYIDEGYALHQAIDLLNRRTWDTAWYGYPSLPAYLTAGALVLTNGARDDLPPGTGRAPGSPYDYDQISPPELILAGRCLVAALSVATVFLAGIVAIKLRGQLAGLLALLFTAICPALVLRGSNVLVDTFATFFALLTLYFCERLRANESRVAAWGGASGFAAGLAFASKYPTGAVVVAVLAAVWFLPATAAGRARFTLLAIAAFFLGVFTGAPATFLKWRSVWHDVAVTAGNYRMIESRPGYFRQAIASPEVGWLLALMGCAGLAFMLRQRSMRSAARGWCLFGAALLAPFLGQPFQPFRNLLPLVPLFCIAAAIAFSELFAWARRDSQPAWRRSTAIALVSATAIWTAVGSFVPLQYRLRHRDSRVQAIDWLQQHATKDDRVLGIRELAILPAEWNRVAARTTVVPWCEALDLLERDQFDYVVIGDFDIRSAPDPAAASVCLARWKEKNAALEAVARFGSGPTFIAPFIWHTNDERVIIGKVSRAKSDLSAPRSSPQDHLGARDRRG